jgi:hypothetical protein
MAYKTNNTVTIADDRAGSFANVTIQNNGFLEVNSSDGFQGTVAGYTSGGQLPAVTNIIDKFPFASDTNASDVGDLAIARTLVSGISSSTNGYTSGGPLASNTIDKFPFATDTNATDVADLTEARDTTTGQSSTASGYTSGGRINPTTTTNVIDKFPFSVDTNATDVGDLTVSRQFSSGHSYTTHGYVSGGTTTSPAAPGITNVIDKFPFSADSNATDVGDLTQARLGCGGQSSTTHGYVSGGQIPAPNTPPIVNTIEKFPFSSDTNATDIADLTEARDTTTGQSSTASGYTSGGRTGSPEILTNVIDKFPFSSDSNATDVGDLTLARRNSAGQQD